MNDILDLLDDTKPTRRIGGDSAAQQEEEKKDDDFTFWSKNMVSKMPIATLLQSREKVGNEQG